MVYKTAAALECSPRLDETPLGSAPPELLLGLPPPPFWCCGAYSGVCIVKACVYMRIILENLVVVAGGAVEKTKTYMTRALCSAPWILIRWAELVRSGF